MNGHSKAGVQPCQLPQHWGTTPAGGDCSGGLVQGVVRIELSPGLPRLPTNSWPTALDTALLACPASHPLCTAGHAGPSAAASAGFSLASVFQTVGAAGPQLAPLHSQRGLQVQRPQASGVPTPTTAAVAAARAAMPPASTPAAAGTAGVQQPPSGATSAGHSGTSCSLGGQPGSRCRKASPARTEPLMFEIEVADLESDWAGTPAGAGFAPSGAWQLGRSPAEGEEVLVGAAGTPSFVAIIQGSQQLGSVGAAQGSDSSGCASSAASHPLPWWAATARVAASPARTLGDPPGVAPADCESAAPHLAACSSSDALVASEAAGTSSSAPADGLIPAAPSSQPGQGGRRLSARPLLALLAQALHAQPQQAAVLAGRSTPRQQKQPAAEDVRPRLPVAPKAQPAVMHCGRAAAWHSADENSPV
ncbi:hypothetical protein ABPG77_005968 [Micractinium sp. CCAP 211/92]